jgi:hypothetical protein
VKAKRRMTAYSPRMGLMPIFHLKFLIVGLFFSIISNQMIMPILLTFSNQKSDCANSSETDKMIVVKKNRKTQIAGGVFVNLQKRHHVLNKLQIAGIATYGSTSLRETSL